MNEFNYLAVQARENEQYHKMQIFEQAEAYANTCHGMEPHEMLTHVQTLLEGSLFAMKCSPSIFALDEREAVEECLTIVQKCFALLESS